MLRSPLLVFALGWPGMLAAQAAKVPGLEAAAASLPAAAPLLRDNGGGFCFRRSPDGASWAWFTIVDQTLISSHDPRPLDLCVAAVRGGGRTAHRIHAEALGPDARAIGPEWLPNSIEVAVGYCVRDDDRAVIACVDRIELVTGKVTALLRVADSKIDSISVATDGRRLAIMVYDGYSRVGETSRRLHIVDASGATQRAIDVPKKDGFDSSASWSPDQKTIAVTTGAGLFFVDADDGEPEFCCAVAADSIAAGKPVWNADGSAVTVAAGGGVVHASPKLGLLHRWTAAELGGRAAAVSSWNTPGVAAAIVEVEKAGSALGVLLGAGHAKQRTFAEVHLLSLVDGSRYRIDSATAEIGDRARQCLPYLPRITEMLQ